MRTDAYDEAFRNIANAPINSDYIGRGVAREYYASRSRVGHMTGVVCVVHNCTITCILLPLLHIDPQQAVFLQ